MSSREHALTASSGEIRFNVNHFVRVKLTDRGRKILRENYARDMGAMANKHPYLETTPDAEGWTRFQLWDLMREFGGSIGCGMNGPFETEIIIEMPQPPVQQTAA